MPTGSTDVFFADIEMVIASFTRADIPRIRQMLAELDRIAKDLPERAAQCMTYKAHLYSKLGEDHNALAAINRAISLAPKNTSLYFIRGRLYQYAGQPAQAIVDFDRVLAEEPDSVSALVHRGSAFQALGDPARAGADYRRALELEPRSAHIEQKLRDLGT